MTCLKKLFLGIFLLLLLGITSMAGAQDLIVGYVLVEYYDDIGSGTMVDDLYNADIFPDEPTEMLWVESFEIATNRADNYGARVGGYLIPPETGDYTFYTASDDSSELFLSTDNYYSNRELIAELIGWTGPQNWENGAVSEPISLVAGQVYYIEADFKEGGGGDNLAVGWTGPGIGDTITVIDGDFLSPYLNSDDDPLIAQYYKARHPSPANAGLADSSEPTLSWTPNIYADHYLVYISTDPCEVVEGTVAAAQSDTNSYIATGLDVSTLYYWRVDGVTADGTVYTGNVWNFTVAAKSAYSPSPADGVLFVDTNADLSWTGGLGAIEHHLYFGSNADDVVAGINDADKGVLTEASFALDTLERGATYYWRVDEFDGTETHTGALWQFQVEYDIPLNEDTNLIGWWKMEEGVTGRVVDWSGHGNHGTIVGDPEWVPGEDGMALDFDGVGDKVETGKLPSELGIGGDAPRTVATWMYIRAFNGGAPYEMGSHSNGQDFSFITRTDNSWRVQHWNADMDFDMEALNEWIHLTQTYDGAVERIYRNGELVLTFEVALNTGDDKPFTMAQYSNAPFDGILDDIRLYNKAVTEEDIAQIMRGNLLRAWNPSPKLDADVDVEQAASLSFNAGDGAVMHDIYLGTSALTVDKALADANLSPEYMGRQAETVLDITAKVEMGQTYYWRVDEIGPNGLLTKGRVWNFNVLDYLIIDDFEDYNDYPPDEVWNTWLDGFEDPTNGSSAGYPDPEFVLGEHYLEDVNVHGGDWSMPLFYDNSVGISEVTRTFTSTMRDWTRQNVAILTLFYYGNAANAAEPMYVALNGDAVVTNDNTNAALITEWTRWDIPLQTFEDMDVNLGDVDSMTIGFGNKANPASSGSTGHVFFDDIRLYRPE